MDLDLQIFIGRNNGKPNNSIEQTPVAAAKLNAGTIRRRSAPSR
jgi:hypothetical protein